MDTNYLKLAVENETGWMLPSFKLNGWNEDICGVSFEIKGTPGIVVHPDCFRTYKENGEPLQSVKVRNMQYEMQYDKDIFRLLAQEKWQTMYLEAFVKEKATRMEYGLKFLGKGEVLIRNIQVKKGGFPENPLVQGIPYVKWINGLKAHNEYERKIKELKSERNALPEHILPYMELSPKTLYDLVPDRRGLGKYCSDFKWDPRNPNVIINGKTGKEVDFVKDYPVSGQDEVIAPSGKKLLYDYHKRSCFRTVEDIYIFGPSYPGPDEDDLKKYYDPKYEKIYLDKFMISTRMECFNEAAHILAEYYNTTGDVEAGIRAAIIFYKITKSIPDWPIYGRPDWNYNYIDGFFPQDDYERWFAWIADSYKWYTPSTGQHLNRMIHIFENLKDDQIWKLVSDIVGCKDARKIVVDGILHIIRMSLKYDAYYRTDIWRYFHNTIGIQLKGFITAGLSIGCPEVIHYAIGKAKAAFGYLFMADGMFAESVSYLHDVAGHINEAISGIVGYSDPEGYISELDNKNITSFKPDEYIPGYKNVMFLCDHRLFYPDGSVMAIHDTWAESQYIQYHNGGRENECNKLNPNRRNKSEPFLLPEFGHAIIGTGKDNDCAEAHLHFSGHYNHSHEDMLNFTVWAYGDELVSDIGYTHLGGYIYTALAHNLVVIDGKNQGFSTMNGRLLSWHAPNDCTMVMQAEAPNIAYSQAHKYRRAILSIPITNGQNIFVDVFEVSGGNRHEWMANGCADYTQKAQMSIEPYKYIDNLDENGIELIPEVGKVVGSMLKKHLPNDRPGDKSQYYGAFRNVKVYRNNKPWQVTITPASPNGEYFPGAGCRAKSKDPKPGLRMHWVAPSDGEVMLCDAPRNRYYKELTFFQEAMANWNKNVMPKIIVRRDGEDLDSTFAAIWEPYKNKPFISSCELIEDILNHEGIGVNIKTENSIINAFYRKVENNNPINSGNVCVDGRFLVIKENLISDIEKQIDVDFYNGKSFSMGGFKFKLANWPKVILLRNGEDTEGAYLVIKGNLESYPVEIEKQPHREKWIILQQEGQNSRYLLFDKLIRCCNNEYKVYLSRQSGFKYDYETNMLIEDHFPYHILKGKIEVFFPSDLNIRIIDSGNDKKIMVRTDSDLYLKVPSEFCSTSQLEVYDESNMQCGTISKNAEQQFYIPCSIIRGKWVSLIM